MTVSSGAGGDGAALEMPQQPLKLTKSAPWWSTCLMPSQKIWSGEDHPAIRFPAIPTKTSRTLTREWTRCSSTFLLRQKSRTQKSKVRRIHVLIGKTLNCRARQYQDGPKLRGAFDRNVHEEALTLLMSAALVLADI